MSYSGNAIPFLLKAAVQAVVNDRGWNSIDGLDERMATKDHPQYPENSIIVKILTQDIYSIDNNMQLCYPFFSSHVGMPLKAGETVWIFKDGTNYYWLSRIHGDINTEDVNYSHFQRSFTSDDPGSSGGTYEEAEASPTLPDFFDNSNAPIYFEGEFNDIMEKNIIHPVPRFRKFPADLTLQGSHNTLINLGIDRGWKKHDDFKSEKLLELNILEPQSNANREETYKFEEDISLGAIDIVAGRGRYPPTDIINLSVETAVVGRTEGVIIETGTEILENPVFENLKRDSRFDLSPVEGDPDFGYDASRLYVAIKTSGDENFSLEHPKIQPVEDSAFIVAKSDEIRLIARRQEASGADREGLPSLPNVIDDINGSIRIIREGKYDGDHANTDGSGQAVIMLLDDGSIHIDAHKITIGSGRENGNGEGDQIFLGEEATEPLVLGTALNALLETHFNDMKSFLSDVFDTHIHPTGVGPSGPPVPLAVPIVHPKIDMSIQNLSKHLSKIGMTK